MLTVGSLVAQESVASALQISAAAEAITITDQVKNTIPEASSASKRRRVSSIGLEGRSELRRNDGKASRPVAPSFNFDYGYDQISGRVIDERTIDRLGVFDRPDNGGSGRYSASLDLENEGSDWSFEVTFTVEF